MIKGYTNKIELNLKIIEYPTSTYTSSYRETNNLKNISLQNMDVLKKSSMYSSNLQTAIRYTIFHLDFKVKIYHNLILSIHRIL